MSAVITREIVKSEIQRTRIQVVLLFLGSLAIGIGGNLIAMNSTGPAAVIVSWVSSAVGGAGALLLGIHLFVILTESKAALEAVPHYENEPDKFYERYGNVTQISWLLRRR